ncbi:MAG: hypothetical protein M0Q91_15110 [Methanoregula sp.]|jgi:hypothetical protein|nr:hypothetical protein [Methanoregula sp.]
MAHAQGHIRDEFYEIIDKIHSDDKWLNSKKNQEQTRRYIGLMWNCTDIIPSIMHDDLADIASLLLTGDPAINYDRGKYKIGNCAQVARLLREILEDPRGGK